MPAYEEISYTLTEEEIEKALQISGYYHIGRKRLIAENVILAVLFLFFLAAFAMNREWFTLAMALVCIAVAVMLYFIPKRDRKQKARQAEKKIRLRIYPTIIYYYGADNTVEIPLKQANIQFDRKNQIFSFLPESGGFLAVPLRAFSQDSKENITRQFLKFQKK